MNYNDFTKDELIMLIKHKDAQLNTLEQAQLTYNGLLDKYKDDYITAIRAAVRAGEAIMAIYNSDDLGVKYKNDASPVTHADKEANAIISLMLNKKIPILSEESKISRYKIRKKWKAVWIVDPLDGTKEFINKADDFTVNIALVYKGVPLFGVIYVPVTKQLYFGMQHVGSYKLLAIGADNMMHIDFDDLVSSATRLPILDVKRPITLVASKSHMNDSTKDFIDRYKQKHANLKVINRGSSLKFCAVAEGAADVYPRFGPTMEWDTAAGHTIVEAAGGRVIKEDLTELRYNRENLLNDNFIASMKNIR